MDPKLRLVATFTFQLLPPWMVYDRRDGNADILPAGRPGAIIEHLPLSLATALVKAANDWMIDGGR